MRRKVGLLVPAVIMSIILLLIYNTSLHRYSLSYLTICGTGWWGIGRFLLWIFALIGVVAFVLVFKKKTPGSQCKCGCQLEVGWCNCPNCGDELR